MLVLMAATLAPPSDVMNSRRFIDRIARQPVAELQDIELAANSQRVAERLGNLVAVVEAFDVRFGSMLLKKSLMISVSASI
jgi:hypothetical protein